MTINKRVRNGTDIFPVTLVTGATLGTAHKIRVYVLFLKYQLYKLASSDF
jgi:hypothetical protein